MNKFLLASTALVLSAGFAAAEVTVGGDGRMGVVYDESQDDDSEFQFNSRIRISFTATGETDGGLQFGGSIRADNAGTTDVSVEADPSNSDDLITTVEGGGVNGLAGSVFVSGAFGKLTMGDIDGANKAATGNVAGVGYTGAGDRNEIDFVGGGDDEGALYEYSFGAATFYASIGQIADSGNGGSQEYGLGVKYDAGTFNVALGYGEDGDAQQVVVKAGTTFAGFDIQALYSEIDDSNDDDGSEYALSAGFTVAGIGATVFYADKEDEEERYGIGGSYDLGGGAALKGGISNTGDDDSLYADFGITMSF